MKRLVIIFWFIVGVIFLPGALACAFIRDEDEMIYVQENAPPYWFRLTVPFCLITLWYIMLSGMYKMISYWW